MAARHRKCPQPNKTMHTTRLAAFRAVLRDPRLVRTYKCKRALAHHIEGEVMLPVPCRACGQIRWLQRNYARETRAANARCVSCAAKARRNLGLGIWRARQAEVDDIAVERLLARTPVKSTRAERQTAVQYLTVRGYTARSIAERIGVSQRTVQRLRHNISKEGGTDPSD